MIVKLGVDVADAVDLAVRRGDADAEELGRDPRQRRVDLRVRSFALEPEALVRLGDERLDDLGALERAGRDVRLLSHGRTVRRRPA